MKTLVNTTNLSHEEWLENRRKGIGGSDAGAILGYNPWSSAYQVYLDKIGEGIPVEVTERMTIGTELEDYVAKKFEEKTGLKVRRKNAILMHDDYDYILANVDRLIVGKNEGLECKVTNSFSRSEWEEDKLPAHYELQCHHYMLVTGYSAWWIAALIGNEKVSIKRIERDEEIITILLDREIDFWENHVVPRIEPPADGSKAFSEALKEKYPDAEEDSYVELVGFDNKLKRRADLDALIKELESEKETIDQSIKQELKNAETGVTGHYTVTWKNQTRKNLDRTSFKKDYPELYEEYQKESTSRVFRIKENK